MFRHASEPRRLPVVALLCCAFNVIATLLVLAGWIGNYRSLVQPISDAAPVVPLTAICVLIATIALLYLVVAKATDRFELLPVSCRWSLAVIVLIMATASEYLFNLHHGLESALMGGRVAALLPDVPYPGRLAPQTALALIVFSLGIYWMGRQSPHAMRDAGIVIAIGMMIPGVALVGHFIHFPLFHTFAGLSRMSMAQPTAILLLILGAGALGISDPRPHAGSREKPAV